MRRIIRLLLALLIALWALSILRAGEAAPLVALRDGILVLVGAAALFSWASRPVRDLFAQSSPDARLPSSAAVLAVLGFATGIGGGAWLLSLLRTGGAETALMWAMVVWGGSVFAMGIAAIWPGRSPMHTEAAVWSVRAAEEFLRHSATDETAPTTAPQALSRRALMIGLILVTLSAAVVRIWNFADLPTGCVGDCAGALQALTFLREDSWRTLLLSGAPLYTVLLAITFGIFTPGMSTLAWLGIGLGIVTVPIFYAAARAVVRPQVALLGALLLALNPWHIVLSRTPQSATLLLLLIAGAIWASRWAAAGQLQRWILAGVLAGLTASTTQGWMAAVLLGWWFLAMPPAHWRGRLLYWAGLLVAAAPTLAALLVNPAPLDLSDFSIAGGFPLLSGWLAGASALIAVISVLALLGLAHLVRRPLWSGTRLLLLGLAASALTLAIDPTTGADVRVPLTMTILILAALVALDQIVGALIEDWAGAVRPATSTALAVGAVAIVLTYGTVNGLRPLENMDTAPMTSAAVGSYLQEVFERSVDNGGEDTTITFVPLICCVRWPHSWPRAGYCPSPNASCPWICHRRRR
ncbi:MAG: glycosyltransferase family 39 protein [Caldilineaceae bacterium]